MLIVCHVLAIVSKLHVPKSSTHFCLLQDINLAQAMHLITHSQPTGGTLDSHLTVANGRVHIKSNHHRNDIATYNLSLQTNTFTLSRHGIVWHWMLSHAPLSLNRPCKRTLNAHGPFISIDTTFSAEAKLLSSYSGAGPSLGRTCFGSTYTKIGTIQRRLAWPLRKDDTQIREAFHIFCTCVYAMLMGCHWTSLLLASQPPPVNE